MTGVGLGAYFATRLARKRGLDPDHIWNALILAVILAIIFLSSGLTRAPSNPLVIAITINVWFKNLRSGRPKEMLESPQTV